MLVDMLMLPITDYDVILGVNWLTKYSVMIDRFNMELSFSIDGKKLSYTLVNLRPKRMHTMEL